ncbi:MAG: YceI family protein [Flavobacteriaceae bacterium]|nr:YceI family protein [Flavobacteriaceae bacterium]
MYQRFFFIAVLLVCMSFNTSDTNEDNLFVKITKESYLSIKGKSNVNSFHCDYNTYMLEQEVFLTYRKNANRILFDDAKLELKNTGFDCGNKMMNKDFHKLLESEKYPNISFKLLEVIPHNEVFDARVAIQIAGVTNEYIFAVALNNSVECLDGLLCINITDFGLEPPKKLLGAVVVKEDIEVHFKFFIENLRA